MTLTATIPKQTFDGDGVTASFPILFTFWSVNDLRVILTDANAVDTDWTKGSQYNITTVGSAPFSGGTLVVIVSPNDFTPQTGEKLTILSDRADSQESSLPLGGPLPSISIETALDQLTRLTQQRTEELSRTMKFAPSEAATSQGDIPALSLRKSTFAAYDANGVPISAAGTSANLGPVTPFVDTLLDDPDELIAKQTLKTFLNNTRTTTLVTEPQVVADDGKLLRFKTSGAATYNLLTAASAGHGFSGMVENATTSTVTIDPNGAELINDSATLILQAGESIIYSCNAVQWRAYFSAGLSLVTLTGTQTLTNKTITSPILADPVVNIGSGSGTFKPTGLANINTTVVGNIGAGPDDLMTYSLPANSLSSDGKSVRVKMWGKTAINANAKSLQIVFGSVLATLSLTINQIGVWSVDGLFIRTGSNAQDVYLTAEEIVDATLTASKVFKTVTTRTNADTSAITIKAVASTVTATDDITQEGMVVEFIN